MARNHEKLEVFHLAHELARDVYELTESWPASERFVLQSQIRRAAVSIPSNIVEGCVRQSSRDYAHFINIALGSAAELNYLLLLAAEVRPAEEDRLNRCRDSSTHVVRALQKLHLAVSKLRD
jgi:four helix bundle protein